MLLAHCAVDWYRAALSNTLTLSDSWRVYLTRDLRMKGSGSIETIR